MRGSWLNAFTPLTVALITIASAEMGISNWVSSVVVILIWFGGLFILVRTQFARRRRNADIFKAFWRSTMLGFALAVGAFGGMYLVGQIAGS